MAQAAGERRAHVRAQLKTSVHLHSEGALAVGFTDNISEGGLFVATDQIFPQGSLVDLQFSLPDGGSFVQARGEVRWTWARDRASDGRPGMGVQFTSIDDGDRARIARFVADRRELFYED